MKMLKRQKGAALISVLFFLIIITTVSAGTIMVATTQVKVAGSLSRWEASLDAAEGGIDFVVPLTKWLHYDGTVPSRYASYVPDATALKAELRDPDSRNDSDKPSSGPDVSFTINPDVNVDIDALGLVSRHASSEFAWGYTATGRAAKAGQLMGYKLSSCATDTNSSEKAGVSQVLKLPVR